MHTQLLTLRIRLVSKSFASLSTAHRRRGRDAEVESMTTAPSWRFFAPASRGRMPETLTRILSTQVMSGPWVKTNSCATKHKRRPELPTLLSALEQAAKTRQRRLWDDLDEFGQTPPQAGLPSHRRKHELVSKQRFQWDLNQTIPSRLPNTRRSHTPRPAAPSSAIAIRRNGFYCPCPPSTAPPRVPEYHRQRVAAPEPSSAAAKRRV
ncbi:hypothetical protein HMN09_00237500 [Mycena chlorophos]|uniref:Uncharacterized protein n=1 Tax=Mycena chlorophos TaxID=658473 RepID=A0A8H6TJS2_MYCCL|nr:hypothetical protein HMN09_00237500 [Mycena chlorophos]